MNMANYKYFYVLPSNDTFLNHFFDLYEDHTETEQRIIRKYNIDTSGINRYGKPRLMVGTGYIEDSPVMIYSGNINVVSLKMFIRNAVLYRIGGYIFCKERDAEYLKGIITKDIPVRVITT